MTEDRSGELDTDAVVLHDLRRQVRETLTTDLVDLWVKTGNALHRFGDDGEVAVAVEGSSFEVPLRGREPRAWMNLPTPALPGDEQAVAAGMRSSLMVPVATPSEVFGVLVAYAAKPWAFHHSDGERVRGLTDAIAQLLLARRLRDAEEALRSGDGMGASVDELAAIGRLSAGVAHEINNPSAYVLNNLEFLSQRLGSIAPGEPVVSDDHRAMTAAVDESIDGIKRVRTIVSDLNVFVGRSSDELEEVQLNRLVCSVARLAASDVRARAQLLFELGDVPPIMVHRSYLTQVLLNVIIRAAESSDRAGAQPVCIRTRCDPSHVEIDIEDHGSAVSSTTKETRLAVSKEVARRLGGDISYEARLGGGSVVRVRIPYQPAVQSRSVSGVSRSVPPPARYRVLVIDDEVALLSALRRSLGAEHDVTTVDSGEKALELLERGVTFDAILCDLLLPGLTGMDVYRHLCAAHPEQAQRMVFITGGAVTAEAAHFIKTQRKRTLVKPLEARDLERVLIEVVEETRIQDTHAAAWSWAAR